MVFFKNVLFLLISLGVLCGCEEENTKKEEVTRTVTWYENHPEERVLLLSKCREDVQLFESSGNCQNAIAAFHRESNKPRKLGDRFKKVDKN